MIRQMVRHKCVALLSIAGVISMGMQPLMAREAKRGESDSVPTWAVQVLTGTGKVKTFSRGPEPLLASRAHQPSSADVERIRQQLLTEKFSTDPVKATAAARALRLFDILNTKDAVKRRAAVRELGVKVTEEPANDGRDGMIRTFTAGGKPRVRLFVPAKQIVIVAEAKPVEFGGPSADGTQTGRWKIGSTCYWDANDSGPDQCSPNSGRWKDDGNDGCYFDGGDSGPDQCEPAVAGTGTGDTGGYSCYYDGHPEPCASQEYYDEALSVYTQSLADYDNLMSDIAATDAEVAAWCSANPGQCDDDELASRSGPYASDSYANCVTDGIIAAGSAILFGSAVWDVGAIFAGPVAGITVAAVAGPLAVALGAGLVAAGAYGAYRECNRALPRDPLLILRPTLNY